MDAIGQLLPTRQGRKASGPAEKPTEQFAQLQTAREDSYWEAAVRQNMIKDDQILDALSKRVPSPLQRSEERT